MVACRGCFLLTRADYSHCQHCYAELEQQESIPPPEKPKRQEAVKA